MNNEISVLPSTSHAYNLLQVLKPGDHWRSSELS